MLVMLVKAKRSMMRPKGGRFCTVDRLYKLVHIPSQSHAHYYSVRNVDGVLMGYWASQEAPDKDKEFQTLFNVLCYGKVDVRKAG